MILGKKFLLALVIYWLPAALVLMLGASDLWTFTIFAVATFSTFGYFLSLVGIAGYFGAWGRTGRQASPERIALEQSDPIAANRIDQMPSLKNQTLGEILIHIVSVYAMWFALFAIILLLMSHGAFPPQENNRFYFNGLGIIALIWSAISWGAHRMNQDS